MFGAFLAQASAGCLASQGLSFVLWGGAGHLDLSPEQSLANNNDASPVRARHSLAFLTLGLSSITSDRVQATSLGSKVPRKAAGFVTDGKGGAGRAGEHCHREGTLSLGAQSSSGSSSATSRTCSSWGSRVGEVPVQTPAFCSLWKGTSQRGGPTGHFTQCSVKRAEIRPDQSTPLAGPITRTDQTV